MMNLISTWIVHQFVKSKSILHFIVDKYTCQGTAGSVDGNIEKVTTSLQNWSASSPCGKPPTSQPWQQEPQQLNSFRNKTKRNCAHHSHNHSWSVATNLPYMLITVCTTRLSRFILRHLLTVKERDIKVLKGRKRKVYHS